MKVSAVPWFWSDQYDLTLQIAGLSDGAGPTVRRDLGNGAFILFHLAPTAAGRGKRHRDGQFRGARHRLAEMLIAKRAQPDPEALGSSDVKLKALLAGASSFSP